MPKFDFYPSFNAGEVSPFIDARTSLEKYRSACRTLENFQILPYGGVIRRPGTQFLGATKFVTAGEVRLIGFNFSTTTRFIIEMGVGYMRFWNPTTGQLQTNTSGGILEVSHPYVGADLREIQYVQINDIMYFAHENYPPRKLSRIADNNWTFEVVDWEFPPQLEQNNSSTTISSSQSEGSTALTASSPIFKSGHVGTKWGLKYKRLSASLDLTINDSIVSNSLDTIGAWDFTTFGKWDAVVRIMRIPNKTWVGGPIEVTGTRSGTTITITHYNHGYATNDFIHIFGGPSAWISDIPYKISVIDTHSYSVQTTNTWVNTPQSITIENLSQMEIVREYDGNADRNVVTSGNESERCGLKIWVSSYNPPIKNGQEVVFSLLPSGSGLNGTTTYSVSNVSGNTFNITTTSGGAVSLTNAAITPGVTTVSIVGGIVSTPMLTISSLSNGLFTYAKDTSPRCVLSNSEYRTGGVVSIFSVAADGLSAQANVVEWLGANAKNNPTTDWKEPAFSGVSGYPRAVALHEQRLAFGGTSKQPTTLWLSEIDNFENFTIGSTASNAVSFTLASSEGNRINWLYSQSKLLVGTTGDEWTIGSSDTAQSLSATNVEARKQSSYGSKYMRASLVNDVLLFVQRNGRKVRELVYEFGKDGWVAPDLTLLAEHITNGEIVEIGYQQQPDAILWCVRGDGTLIAMTYERDQKVVGWHRHTIADNADVESVATIYGNGTEDEVWMVVKRTVSGQDYRTIERFPLLWRTQFDNQSSANYRYLDGHVAFASGAAGRTVSGLAHLNGKTVTVMLDSGFSIRTVSGGSITIPSASAGYLGLPYTSTLRPMKLDADFEDGTAQSRKKRIHQVVVRTLKSRGGEVRTNNGTWYALAPTTTTGDQKIILGGAFGIDADVDVRQTEPYPMCIISILPKWDAYGNE
jgi:hypothetical protein